MRIPKLTYGNVTATIALFAALAGTSYAAVTVTGSSIQNGSLTGADLKNESVKGSDIDNSSLTGSDLKNGSVTSSDVDDGSLLASDFKPGELLAGPAGPQGPGGLSNVVVRRSEVTVPAMSTVEGTASCANGETAVSGGVGHSGVPTQQVFAIYSAPLAADGTVPDDGEPARRWVAALRNLTTSPRTLEVHALCVKP
jgi:hypothetical protein